MTPVPWSPGPGQSFHVRESTMRLTSASHSGRLRPKIRSASCLLTRRSWPTDGAAARASDPRSHTATNDTRIRERRSDTKGNPRQTPDGGCFAEMHGIVRDRRGPELDIGARCEIDHFILRHTPPHVGARNVEARRPSVVEHLPSRNENEVHRHVVDPRHVPQEPHQRVEALARSYPHLLVRQRAEDQIGQRRAGRDIRGVDSSVLKVEEGQGIHTLKRNLHARSGENYKASRPRHAVRSSGVAHSPSAPASPSSDSEPY